MRRDCRWSLTGQYAFVDGVTLAPFLKASGRDLFARYPALEREARTWEAYAPDSAESADEIAEQRHFPVKQSAKAFDGTEEVSSGCLTT